MPNRYFALLDTHGEVVVTLATRRPALRSEDGYRDCYLPEWDTRRFVDLNISVASGDGRIAGSESVWDGLPPPWCDEIVFVESKDPWPKGGPRPKGGDGLRGTVSLWNRKDEKGCV